MSSPGPTDDHTGLWVPDVKESQSGPAARSHRLSRRWRLSSLVVLLLLWRSALPIAAQRPDIDPQKAALVKENLMYHFVTGARWPEATFASPDDPIRVGLVAAPEDLMVQIFERRVADLRRRHAEGSASGRPLATHRVALPGDGTPAREIAAQLESCHAVYVSAEADGHLETLLEGLQGPVLTIGEEPAFLDAGGMIAFVITRARVRYQISLSNLDRVGLRMEAPVMQHAMRIR